MRYREILGNKPIELEIDAVFSEAYDVIVCGGGTAGAIAVLAAVQEGVSTLCIEPQTYLGGMGTGIVMGYYDGDALSGMCADLDNEIRAESKTVYCDIKKWCAGIHCEAKKFLYEKEYQDKGGKIYYSSMPIGVFVEGDAVCGIRVLKDGTVLDIGCRVIIDATSEANLCRLAHLPTVSGRQSDNQCQAYSVVSFIMNEENELEHVYRDNGFVDDGDMYAVSRAITSSFAQSDTIGAYNKSTVPNKMLVCGSVFGKREGLHSVGLDSFTGENLLEFKPVKLPLFKTSGPYDTHLHDGAMESDLVNRFLVKNLRDLVLTMSFPYGAMIPKGIEGMLTVGLSMDVDHDALAPVRLKKTVMRSGEAAGVAAAISCKKGKRLIDCYEELKEQLNHRKIFYDRIEIPAEMEQKVVDEQISEELKVFLLGKQNKGQDTQQLSEYLNETENYQLFSYAFTALVESAVNGDELALCNIRKLLEHKEFSRKLRLNGKQVAAVIERNDSLREYAARRFDEKGIKHEIKLYMKRSISYEA